MNKSLIYGIAAVFLLLSCVENEQLSVEDGTSIQLATQRASVIRQINYDLTFDIPESIKEPINGNAKIGFKLNNNEDGIWLDFNSNAENPVSSIQVNDTKSEVILSNGHLYLKPDLLKKGYNKVLIDFIAGDMALNRNEDFLYTLFVPDKASTAFPCFDQPDLKARLKLSLNIPVQWKALSNAPAIKEEIKGESKLIEFDNSDLLSTYLFSFVVGNFQSITREIDNLEMTMFHRETDSLKVNKNLDVIFKQHYEALRWLEDYTDIKYPFKKFDFALIPGFQYGGMEHTGAIQYRASRLFLEESASLEEEIARSMLIAHETAHMWFGNLVTMKWFDDVWMKEVFANFMASKITEPRFPDVDHDLNFLFAHYPPAYEVDRTDGANAIRQELDNLKNAGSMYGAIIYHKAPIAMRQLEILLGEYAFRDALREYLSNFSNKNADWNDLIGIMDVKTSRNLRSWSQTWINEPGMPFVDIDFLDQTGQSEYDIVQYDLSGQNRFWPQQFSISFGYTSGDVSYPIESAGGHFSIKRTEGTIMPGYIQLNSDGKGYGIFAYGLGYTEENFSFDLGLIDAPSIANDLQRGAAYLSLHEYLLHEGMKPVAYLRYLEEYIFVEENELILNYLLDNLELIFWKFLSDDQNKALSREVESLLVQKMARVEDLKVKHMLFKKYASIARSDAGIRDLMNFWSGEKQPTGLALTEEEFSLLAYQIALKSNQITGVLEEQLERITNPDRKKKFAFISQALSQDQEELNTFFHSLLEPENREHESWVGRALYYLNHPANDGKNLEFMKMALNEVEEVQATGDIFFPKVWLDNSLWGYNSSQAVEIINEFLRNHEKMNTKLKQKVLQSADMVFRAERCLAKYGSSMEDIER